jgi:glycosyltransferase involved in cell wall biosynthesis
VRIVQFLKWMRRRDGGVVNTISLLCPMHARVGHRVVLLSCEDDDLSAEQWIKVDARRGGAGVAANLWTDEALWERSVREGRPVSIRVDLADPVARLRGRSAYAAERDLPTQVLTRHAKGVAREVLRGAEVLHLHGPWATPNVQMGAVAREVGCAYVVSPHGMLDDWCMSQGALKKKLHLAIVGRRMLDGARAVHFEGSVEMNQGRKYTQAPVTSGPPPPIDPRPFTAQAVTPDLARATFPQLTTSNAVVLFLGRLNYKKGPDKLLHAAAKWKAAGVPVTVIIAGLAQPPEFGAYLPRLAKELGVTDMCHFVGLVTGEAKWSLLAAADLVVLPTMQENFGIALVEALAVGTPVLTTKGVDIWPELRQSGGGIVVEGGEGMVEQLTGAVADAVRDRAALRAMGGRARAWALETEEPGTLAEWYVRMLRGECSV